MNTSLSSFALAALCLLVGCASTKVDTTGASLAKPLCQVGEQPIRTAIHWTPQWRPDQKEPLLREAAALRGIQSFVDRAGCPAVTEMKRLPTQASPPDDESLQALAAKSSQSPERVVLIVVRELGPRITIGIPVIIQGQTEVLIDVRVLRIQPHESLARTQTFWRNGGIFVVKGVKTLDQDMSTALMATLMLTAEPK